ncbi:MAG: hypothetical protein R3F20_19690 [Planctomycetota bacterium]
MDPSVVETSLSRLRTEDDREVAFADALRRGLGRAIFLARELDPTRASEILIDALRRDELPESEGAADWVLDLAAECHAETILAHLLAPAETEDAPCDAERTRLDLRLLSRLAREGDEGARAALYRHFVRQLEADGSLPIVTLDGLQGFMFIVETVGQRLVREPGFEVDLSVYRDACRRLGKAGVDERLTVRAERSPYAAAFLEEVRAFGAWGPRGLGTDGERCELKAIAPDDALLERAIREPEAVFRELEFGPRRAGLVLALGRRGELDAALLHEALFDANDTVRSAARRFYRGHLALEFATERRFEVPTPRRLSVREFVSPVGSGDLEVTEVLAALRASKDWGVIERPDGTCSRARRGPYAVESIDAVHLRPRPMRELRIALVDWLTDDPFTPVPVPTILDALDFVRTDGVECCHALLPGVREDGESAEAWESWAEWWVVDAARRRVLVFEWETRNG